MLKMMMNLLINFIVLIIISLFSCQFFLGIHESLTHPSKKKGRKKLSDSFPG